MPEKQDDIVLHNCHIHTFTMDCVPLRFLPPPLGWLMRHAVFRVPILAFLKAFDPFKKRDLLQRFANFLETSASSSQSDVFRKIERYYPTNTKFIVLPMDMEFMDAGPIPLPLSEQHAQLHRLSSTPQYAGRIIPFVAIDPRRRDALAMLTRLVEEKHFRGIKIYPPLGYFPNDPGLLPIYAYAQEKRLPVIAHCSKGGVRHNNLSAAEASARAHPHNYREILTAFPELKLCLAHFGGDTHWRDYLENPGDPDEGKNWLRLILDMIRGGKYPNLYTDISSVILCDPEFISILHVLLQNHAVADRVLFGSDFYMVEKQKTEEKKISLHIRSRIGENLFRKIAEENPKRFLA